MANGRFESKTGTNLEIEGIWSSVADTAGNYSTVTVELYLIHYSIYSAALGGSYVKIGREIIPFTKSVTQSEDKWHKTHLGTFSAKVDHNADGTCSVSLGAGWNFSGTYSGTYLGMIEGNCTAVLDTIPRASGFKTSGEVTIGEKNSVTVTINNSSYKHKITWKVGSKSITTEFVENVADAFIVPDELAQGMPNARSASGQIFLSTYRADGTLLGDTVQSVTYYVPRNEKFSPTFDFQVFSVSDYNYLTDNNIFAKGISKAGAKVLNASAKQGATVSSCSIAFGSSKISGFEGTSAVLDVGSIEVSASVTDSRGITTVSKKIVKAAAYASPFASAVTAFRCDESGAYLENGSRFSISAKGNCSKLDGENSASMTFAYKIRGMDDYGEENPLSDDEILIVDAGLVETLSYDVRITCSDKVGISTETIVNIPTSKVDMHMKNGAVRFGGYCEKKGFECDWNANFKGGVTLNDAPISDFVTDSGQLGIWHWRKWNSGFSECFGKTEIRSYDVTVPWGALFHNEDKPNSVELPPGLFLDTPSVQATPQRDSAAVFIAAKNTGSIDRSPDFYVVYPENKTVSVGLALHCFGKWK